MCLILTLDSKLYFCICLLFFITLRVPRVASVMEPIHAEANEILNYYDYYVLASENSTCKEFKDMFIGSIFYFLSKPQNFTGAHFYLAEKGNEDGFEIGENDWSALKTKNFDPSKKTYFIIHGYMSNYKKKWVAELKETLLETSTANIILVDWSKGSYRWNYVNSVRITQHVSKDLIKFLDDMKTEVEGLNTNSEVLYNNLYFIGHSLGAHISGQVGHVLKKNSTFYKVERITGLDPAQPCFTQIDESLKIDKNDADFVDIIHTQTGSGTGISGFGLKESVGHIDFYVNGGVMQPQCEGSFWNAEINKMICSHKIVCKFFVESVKNSKSSDCKFVGHSWNGTYLDAVRILNETEKGSTCSNCPEMGINASKSSKTGTYLVITSSKKTNCSKVETNDIKTLQKELKRLESKEAVFEPYNLEDHTEDPFA